MTVGITHLARGHTVRIRTSKTGVTAGFKRVGRASRELMSSDFIIGYCK